AHRWACSVGAGMMAVAYRDLEDFQAACATDGEFHPEGMLSDRYSPDPISFWRTQANTGLALLTRNFGIQGYATSVHTACASGGQALGTALKVMRRRQVDFMLAGGYDSMLNPIGLSG